MKGRVVAGTVDNSAAWLKFGRVIFSTGQSLTHVTSGHLHISILVVLKVCKIFGTLISHVKIYKRELEE